MAQRLIVAGTALAGLAALALRPLVGLILLATALVLVVDRRGAFGHGVFRTAIAFITGLWIGVAGVAATLLGMLALPGSCDPSTTACDDAEGNFLFVPGLLLLALGLTLLGWSVVELLRIRRAGRRPRRIDDARRA